ncbi:hypothetical protein MRX96_006084 [Rhipicephalus microplus]
MPLSLILSVVVQYGRIPNTALRKKGKQVKEEKQPSLGTGSANGYSRHSKAPASLPLDGFCYTVFASVQVHADGGTQQPRSVRFAERVFAVHSLVPQGLSKTGAAIDAPSLFANFYLCP